MIHPEEIKAISRKIISLTQNFSIDASNVSKEGLGDYIDISRGGVRVLLFGPSLLEYKKLLERLLVRNQLSTKASERYISGLLKSLICEQALHESSLEAVSESLSKKLRSLDDACKQYVVYLPLDGFFLYEDQVQALELGQVCIEKMIESKFKALLNDLKAIWIANPYYTTKEKEYILKDDEESLHNAFFNRVCAKFCVEAEPQRAIEIAIENTQNALALLRYSVPILYPRSNHELRIGINGEAGIKRTTAFALSSPKDSYYFSSFSRSTKTFNIDKSTLPALEKIGIFKVARFLKKEHQITEFEKALLDSIRWFSFSQNQLTASGELLYLTICMEVFLCPDAGEKVSNSITEGVAFILRDELEGRKTIKEKVKRLYGLRSVVAHGRGKSVLESNVVEMQEIVLTFISKMIEFSDEIKSLKDLDNWIENEKLK